MVSAILCAIAATLAVADLPIAIAAASPATEPPVPFAVGETLDYDVGWSSYLTAGSATLTVREKKPSFGSIAYYVVAEGRASGVVAALYHAYYKADTLLDVYSLLPQRGSVYAEEGKRKRLRVTRFDQAKRTAQFAVTPGTVREKAVALPGPTHDALSAILAVRMLRFRDGLATTIPVSDGGRVFRVRVTVRGREQLATRLGQIMAWRIEPAIMDDAGDIGARTLRLWISDDARKLPLLMEAEMAVGTFTLTLRSAR